MEKWEIEFEKLKTLSLTPSQEASIKFFVEQTLSQQREATLNYIAKNEFDMNAGFDIAEECKVVTCEGLTQFLNQQDK